MPSERQIAANRANAQKSTGPRTLAGRARASQNSLRHGLSLKTVMPSAILDDYIGELTEGTQLNHSQAVLLTELIAAEFQARDVSRVRLQLALAVIGLSEAELDIALDRLARLGRYDVRARARRRKALKAMREAKTF